GGSSLTSIGWPRWLADQPRSLPECAYPARLCRRTISSYESPPQSTKISKEVDFHPRGEPRSWQTHLPGPARVSYELPELTSRAGSGAAPGSASSFLCCIFLDCCIGSRV